MTDSAELARLMAPVALRLLGEPTEKNGDVWRWGSRGSFCADVAKGVWYDHEASEGKGVLALIEREAGVSGAERFRWLEREGLIPPTGGKRKLGREVEHYDYTDEQGAVLFQVVRFAEPKDFRQRAPSGAWSIKGIRRVPYRLPELRAALDAHKRIWVVEGERDVDRLRSEGLVGTCNPMGAGEWKDECTAPFRGTNGGGADVIVCRSLYLI
jgi:hypothetical protein